MSTSLSLTYRGRVLLLLGLLCALAAWISENDTSVRLAAAMLLAPFALDLLVSGTHLPDIVCTVARRRTQAGTPFQEHVLFANRSRFKAVHEALLREPRTDTYSGGCLIRRLGPGEQAQVVLPARSKHRGRFPVRVLLLTSTYPLGLFRRSTALHEAEEMVSEPTRTPLPAHIEQALMRDHLVQHAKQSFGQEDFHSMREYQHGEDARLVHAMRSASAGTLVRRVLQSKPRPETCVILDLRRPPGRMPQIGSRRLEWSLGATATLVDRMRAERCMLTVFVVGEEPTRWTIGNGDDAEHFLSFLAEARPVQHFALPQETLEPFQDTDAVFWVPAGGFKATEDRRIAGDPMIVTEWEP